MKVRASTILKACYDREYEKQFSYRYASAGYPPIKVIWNIPKTSENLKLVKEFLLDYSSEFNPFANFLHKLSREASACISSAKNATSKLGKANMARLRQ